MTYPKFRNKWTGESLVSPIETSSLKKIKAKGVIPKNLPKRYIISYQNDELKYFKKKYGRKFRKFEPLRSEVLFCKDFGFVSVNGIGSPHAVMVLEQLIALGGREFISIGVAGGLKGWGIFLCDKAVRDEGTSYHYIPHGEFAHPDAKLTEKLGRCLAKAGIKFEKAPTWTIDAPYRETKAEIRHYRKRGIATVEMEAAALFAVAKVRKVKIAAAFAVSDLLGKKWENKFGHKSIVALQHKLIDAAVECFK